jgi:hypothetical protein
MSLFIGLKKVFLKLSILIIALVLWNSTATNAQDATLLYKKTVNSTVTIQTDQGLGSGFFVAPSIIATNYHVIEGASEAYCFLNNSDEPYEIEGYLAADQSVDLILLKVAGVSRQAIPFSSDVVSPGQKIYALGSPKGLPATISDGIVSGIRDFDGYKLIQMTAPISPGSSGGPVLNVQGEIIGVSVSQLESGQNLNFAIPKSYLEILLQFKKEIPKPLYSLYSSSNISGEYENNESNYQQQDVTYEIGIFKTATPELSLDYIAHFGEKSCFYFTYDMTQSSLLYQNIYMEDYRLVDLESGEVYYGTSTDLSTKENSRVIYRGTKSRFVVCFDRLPAHVRYFSLMEGDCTENSFCFLNINITNFSIAQEVNWRAYQGNNDEGTVSFYTNQNIGIIDIYFGEYKVGTISRFFLDPNYIPSCGDTGDAMLTVRLESGTYDYTAVCGQTVWRGNFTITREGCHKINFTR